MKRFYIIVLLLLLGCPTSVLAEKPSKLTDFKAIVRQLQSKDEKLFLKAVSQLQVLDNFPEEVANELVSSILKGSKTERSAAIGLLAKLTHKPRTLVPAIVSKINGCEYSLKSLLPICQRWKGVLFTVYSSPDDVSEESLSQLLKAFKVAQKNDRAAAMYETGTPLAFAKNILPEFLDTLVNSPVTDQNVNAIANILYRLEERATEVGPEFFARYLTLVKDPRVNNHAWRALYSFEIEARPYYSLLSSTFHQDEVISIGNFSYNSSKIGRCDKPIPRDLLLVPVDPAHSTSVREIQSRVASAKKFSWCECSMLSHLSPQASKEVLDGLALEDNNFGPDSTLMFLFDCLSRKKSPLFLVDYIFENHPEPDKLVTDLVDRDIIYPNDVLDAVVSRFDRSKGFNFKEQEFLLTFFPPDSITMKNIAHKFLDSANPEIRTRALETLASSVSRVKIDTHLLTTLLGMLTNGTSNERETSLSFIGKLPPLTRVHATNPEDERLISEFLLMDDIRILRWLWAKRSLQPRKNYSFPELIARYPYEDIAPIIRTQAAIWVGGENERHRDLELMLETIVASDTRDDLRNDLINLMKGLLPTVFRSHSLHQAARNCLGDKRKKVKELCYWLYELSAHTSKGPSLPDVSIAITDLDSDSHQIKVSAALALLKIVKEDPSSITPYLPKLIGGIETERDPLRQHFANILGYFPDHADKTVPVLIKASEDPYFALSGSAVGSLQKLSTPAARTQLSSLYRRHYPNFVKTGDTESLRYLGWLWSSEGTTEDAGPVLQLTVNQLRKKPHHDSAHLLTLAAVANKSWSIFESTVGPFYLEMCSNYDEHENKRLVESIVSRLMYSNALGSGTLFLKCLQEMDTSREIYCKDLLSYNVKLLSKLDNYTAIKEQCT